MHALTIGIPGHSSKTLRIRGDIGALIADTCFVSSAMTGNSQKHELARLIWRDLQFLSPKIVFLMTTVESGFVKTS